MTVESSTPFIMHGARVAMASGLVHIKEQIEGIEQAVIENPGLAFDLARTLIETTCRTILTERGVAFDLKDDLPKLFKTATKHLPFLPTAESGAVEVRKSLAQTLKGLSTAVQGVCELRNLCGFASHGSDSPRPAMEAVQALLVAETSDAVVGFLHRVHRQDRIPIPSMRPEYDENSEFNDHIDEIHDIICILGVEFRPSEVLFQMEPETYRIYLADFNAEPESEDDSEMSDDQGESKQ